MVKIIRIIGYLLVFLGVAIPIGYETKNEITTYQETKEIEAKIEEQIYYAVLEIPQISFLKEIYNDTRNNVDKNIYLHPESIMPDQELSNPIILGHSGNGKNAYFKNLYKLNIGSEVKLYYDNYLYLYEIKEIETQPKTGTLALKRISDHMLTLITCTKNNKNTQTIYYADLKNKEKILEK